MPANCCSIGEPGPAPRLDPEIEVVPARLGDEVTLLGAAANFSI
jgi:hypothetical protein